MEGRNVSSDPTAEGTWEGEARGDKGLLRRENNSKCEDYFVVYIERVKCDQVLQH